MNKKQFGVFEREPAHGKEKNGIILGPFDSEEEAIANRLKYGYNNHNYYVRDIEDNAYDFFMENKDTLKTIDYTNSNNNNDFIKLYKDKLSEFDMFKNAEIIIIDTPHSVVDGNDKPVHLKSFNIKRDTKFKGKFFLYDVNITPGHYKKEDIYETINGGLITPAFFNPKNFSPYRKIILEVDVLDGDMEVKRKILHDKLDDIINNPNNYEPYQHHNVILRGLFEEVCDDEECYNHEEVKNYSFSNDLKYSIVFYMEKNFIKDNEFKLDVKTAILPNEYQEDYLNTIDKNGLPYENDIINFYNKHNLNFNEYKYE